MTASRAGVPTRGQPLSTAHLDASLEELQAALEGLADHHPGDMAYRIHGSAAIKQFELILELSGKLLRMRLRDWFASNRDVDRLVFKDVFRAAARFTLISADVCERWLEYRDLRNDTAHDDGETYPEATLDVLPRFVTDTRALRDALDATYD